MTGSTIKVRLRAGQREIEIEGSRKDVDDLLTKFWSDSWLATEPLLTENGDHGVEQLEQFAKRTLGKKKRKPIRDVGGKSGPKAAESAFDPTAIVNRIKEDERHETFQKKIVQVRGDPYHKAAFVAWFADTPLTSGQIHKVLEGLGVKVSLPRLSGTLSENSHDLITSGKRSRGGAPITYHLSSPAKTAFESWLLSNGK
jgi:hypothetical protein